MVECHEIRTRGPETRVLVDLHLLVAPDTTVERGHGIAHEVETALRARFPQVADVVVHVEPAEAKSSTAGGPPEKVR